MRVTYLVTSAIALGLSAYAFSILTPERHQAGVVNFGWLLTGRDPKETLYFYSLAFSHMDSEHYWSFVSHMVTGGVYSILGVMNLSTWLRRYSISLHRTVGYLYILWGIGASLTAMRMGLTTQNGINVAVCSVMFGGYGIMCLMFALYFVKTGRIDSHRRWMVRNFAVNCIGSAFNRVFAVVYLYVIPLYTEQDLNDDRLRHEYFSLVFWSGFVVPTMICEVVLQFAQAHPREKSSGKKD